MMSVATIQKDDGEPVRQIDGNTLIYYNVTLGSAASHVLYNAR